MASRYYRLATFVLIIAPGQAFRHETETRMRTDAGLKPPRVDPVPAYFDADPRPSITKQQELQSEMVSARSAEDGWHKFPRASHRTAYGLVHIPKTAGSSFAKDATAYIPDGDGYFSAEECPGQILRKLKQKCEGGLFGLFFPQLHGMSFELFAFLRNPIAHVYSQYLELRYDAHWSWPGKPKFAREVPNITAFLDRFTSGPGAGRADYPAYHPQDMQTRALVCEADNHGYLKMTEDHLARALEAVKAFKFIGITEHYQASVCVFHDRLRPELPLPAFCDCRDEAKWSAFPHSHVAHGVPKHSLSDLSRADVSKADRLTRMDQRVYRAALDRFHGEVLELEKRRGMRILCQPL